MAAAAAAPVAPGNTAGDAAGGIEVSQPAVRGFMTLSVRPAAAVLSCVAGQFAGPACARPLIALNFGSRVVLAAALPQQTTVDEDDELRVLEADSSTKFEGDDLLTQAAAGDTSNGAQNGLGNHMAAGSCSDHPAMADLVTLPQQTGHVAEIAAVPYFTQDNRSNGGPVTRHALFVYDEREEYRVYGFEFSDDDRLVAVQLAAGVLADVFHTPGRNGPTIVRSHAVFPVVAVHTYERLVRIVNLCAVLCSPELLEQQAETRQRRSKKGSKATGEAAPAVAASPSPSGPTVFNARVSEAVIDDICFAAAPRASHCAGADASSSAPKAGSKRAPAGADAARGGNRQVIEEISYGLDMVVLSIDRKKARRTLSTYALRLDVAMCIAVPGAVASVTAAVASSVPGQEVRDLERAATRLAALPRGVAVCGPSQVSFFSLGTTEAQSAGSRAQNAPPGRRQTGHGSADETTVAASVKHEGTIAVDHPAAKGSDGVVRVPQVAACTAADPADATFVAAFDNGAIVVVTAPDRLARVAPPRARPCADGSCTAVTGMAALLDDACPVPEGIAVVPGGPLSAVRLVFVASALASSTLVEFPVPRGPKASQSSAKHVDPTADLPATAATLANTSTPASAAVVTHRNLGPIMSAVANARCGPIDALPSAQSGIIAGCGAGGDGHSALCHIRGGVAVSELVALSKEHDESITQVRSVGNCGGGFVAVSTAIAPVGSTVAARVFTFNGGELGENDDVTDFFVGGTQGEPASMLATSGLGSRDDQASITVTTAGVCTRVQGSKHERHSRQALGGSDFTAAAVHPAGIVAVANAEQVSAFDVSEAGVIGPAIALDGGFAASDVGAMSLAVAGSKRYLCVALWSARDCVVIDVDTKQMASLFSCLADGSGPLPLPRSVQLVALEDAPFATVLIGTDEGQLVLATMTLPGCATNGSDDGDVVPDATVPAASSAVLRAVSLGRAPVTTSEGARQGEALVGGEFPATVRLDAARVRKPTTPAEAARRVIVTNLGTRGVLSAACAPTSWMPDLCVLLQRTADGSEAVAFVRVDMSVSDVAVSRVTTAGTVTQIAMLAGSQQGLIACAVSEYPNDRIHIASTSGSAGLRFLDHATGAAPTALANGEVCTALASFDVEPDRVHLRRAVGDGDIASPTGGASSATFDSLPQSVPVLVATSATLSSEESRPSSGRILVFAVQDHRAAPRIATPKPGFRRASESRSDAVDRSSADLLNVIVERDLPQSAAYAVCQVDPRRIAIAINGSVSLFKLRVTLAADAADSAATASYELVPLHNLRVGVQITALRLWAPYVLPGAPPLDSDETPTLLLAGDAYNSVTALTLSRTDDSIEFFGKDTAANRYMMDFAPVGGFALASDEQMNLYCLDLCAALSHANMAPSLDGGPGAEASPSRQRMRPRDCVLRRGPAWHCGDRVTTVVANATCSANDLAHAVLLHGGEHTEGVVPAPADEQGGAQRASKQVAPVNAVTKPLSPFLAAPPALYGTTSGGIGAALPLTRGASAVLNAVAAAAIDAVELVDSAAGMRAALGSFRAPLRVRDSEASAALAARLRTMSVEAGARSGPTGNLPPTAPDAASKARGHVDGDLLRDIATGGGAFASPSVLKAVARQSSTALFGSDGARLLDAGQLDTVALSGSAQVIELLSEPDYATRVLDRCLLLVNVGASAEAGPPEMHPNDGSKFLAWNADLMIAFLHDVLSLA